MALHESGEDYLEAILILKEERGTVRSVDVAQQLGFSKPSVSRAVSILRADGLLEMDSDGRLELTPAGEAVARKIYERHCFLTRWLTHIGVTPATAAADACRLEHVISAETFLCLRDYARQQEEKRSGRK